MILKQHPSCEDTNSHCTLSSLINPTDSKESLLHVLREITLSRGRAPESEVKNKQVKTD